MMAKLPIKNIITEVLLLALILPLYVTLFVIWWQFLHIMKMMADIENMLKEDEFFTDTVDATKEGVKQHVKQECLKGAISKGKVLGGKKQ